MAGEFFNGNGDVKMKSVYDKLHCKQSLDCDLLYMDYNKIQSEIDRQTGEDIRPIAHHVHHSKKSSQYTTNSTKGA